MVGWGNGTSDPEPQRMLEEKDITWNTHRQIKDHFDYPQDEELFGDWLQWFYSLTNEQKQTLRNTDLKVISTGAFPATPHSTKETS